MRNLLLALLCTVATQGHAATIYLCRAYNGSTFWAKQHCNRHNALIERTESVADVPWDQQVEQAERSRERARTATTANGQPAFNRLQYCAQLTNERRQIESRYTNWQWQPPEVINPDQQRTVAINSALRANNCPVQ